MADLADHLPNIRSSGTPMCSSSASVIPRGVDKTTNIVEFYYPRNRPLRARVRRGGQAAYNGDVAEDHEIALRMAAGRRALYSSDATKRGVSVRRWKTHAAISTSIFIASWRRWRG